MWELLICLLELNSLCSQLPAVDTSKHLTDHQHTYTHWAGRRAKTKKVKREKWEKRGKRDRYPYTCLMHNLKLGTKMNHYTVKWFSSQRNVILHQPTSAIAEDAIKITRPKVIQSCGMFKWNDSYERIKPSFNRITLLRGNRQFAAVFLWRFYKEKNYFTWKSAERGGKEIGRKTREKKWERRRRVR